jgi:hypothetical protein
MKKGLRLDMTTFWIRLACIEQTLKTMDHPSMEDFRKAFIRRRIHVCGKTVYRDTELLRKDMGANIKYDRAAHGFVMQDTEWDLRAAAHRYLDRIIDNERIAARRKP